MVHLLGPVHAHEAMHLAQMSHLHLATIPKLIMRLRLFKLFPVHGRIFAKLTDHIARTDRKSAWHSISNVASSTKALVV